jgi:DNA-binding HxlR family transcriptional regulator
LIKYQKDSSFLKESGYLFESCYFCIMASTNEQDQIVTKAECTSNMKNVVDALYVLNGKWKLPIVLSLVTAPKRFNEIMKDLNGISPKILAQELKHLEQNELVVRKVFPTTPVSIIYEASEYSETLKDVLSTLSDWGAGHRKKIIGKA